MQTDAVIASWAESGAPPPQLTVSEWADRERILPESSAARGGRWRTSVTPYLRGIMDAVLEPGVKQIAVRKCAQSGGSEALHNILAYFIAYDPCPMLVVQPTVEVAEEWSKERLADMIRTTPALRSVVRDKRSPRGSHTAESTLSFKTFPGGFLALGGANSPNTYARRAARLAMGDDVDRFPAVVGEEGDPAELLVNRTTTFHDALILFVSTPTLKGGRIDTLYTRSDQRQYVVTCPVCGRADWIAWNDAAHFRVVFDGMDADSARIECPSVEHGGCGAKLYEPEREALIAGGSWRATAPTQDLGLVGFHLPAMLSPFVSLPALVGRWLSARARGKEALRVFINTMLAEGWEDRGARMDPHTLLLGGRRHAYGERRADGADVEVPAAAPVLTAGVDVQADRFELMVTAWGPGQERWVVDWRTIPGNPRHLETREELLKALGRKYLHASGHQLPITATCLDTGYATEEMYDFVLAYQGRQIFATKGYAGKSGEPIVGKPAEKRYGRGARPVRLYPINVDDAKADVLNALTLTAAGPGYLHLPEHVDTVGEEFCAQLCAEHRETRYNKSNVATHAVWVQDRERNEALDCAVLCLAAYKRINPNIRQMREALEAATVKVDATPEPVPVAGEPAQTRPTDPRRLTRSNYLGR